MNSRDSYIGSLLAADDYAHFKTYMIASISGIFSLFPLLFTPSGEPFSCDGTSCLTLAQKLWSRRSTLLSGASWYSIHYANKFTSERTHVIAYEFFSSFSRFPTTLPLVILEQLENAHLLGFAPLLAFILAFPLIFGGNSQVEFLPLMMTSVYCALGLAWAFIRLGTIYLRQ